MEIEKKYLIKNLPPDLNGFNFKQIEQAYISFEPVIRIRKSDNEFYLTVKGKGHLAREEFEIKISGDEYCNLLKKTEGLIISKKRYIIPLDNNLRIELDIFENDLKGLIVAEVEFNTIAESEIFIKPEWFGDDITFDPSYKNNNLAKSK